MLLDRLYPRPGPIEAADAVSGLDLGSRASARRPYLVLNMIASLDGRAAVEGTTRALGGEVDRELFHTLRTQADAILVGAGTVRAERYGKAVKSDASRAKREAQGLAAEPVTVIVSHRMDLSADLPLLSEPGERVIVATAAEGEIEGVTADVSYERTGDDLALLLARLREHHDVRSVLCEGGPTLNGHLIAAGLVDELFLTLDPQLVGGADPLTIVAGPAPPAPARAELVTLLRADEGLFGRWRLA